MRILLLLTFLTSLTSLTRAQKVDSFAFHLYTDSLKKGTFNYINVDGKLSDGRWMPLTSKELVFTSSAGKFEGNSLFIDTNFTESKVTVRITLRNNSALYKEIIIPIKTRPNDEKLKTTDELIEEWKRKGKEKKNKDTSTRKG